MSNGNSSNSNNPTPMNTGGDQSSEDILQIPTNLLAAIVPTQQGNSAGNGAPFILPPPIIAGYQQQPQQGAPSIGNNGNGSAPVGFSDAKMVPPSQADILFSRLMQVVATPSNQLDTDKKLDTLIRLMTQREMTAERERAEKKLDEEADRSWNHPARARWWRVLKALKRVLAQGGDQTCQAVLDMLCDNAIAWDSHDDPIRAENDLVAAVRQQFPQMPPEVLKLFKLPEPHGGWSSSRPGKRARSESSHSGKGCSACGAASHVADQCWRAHPNLAPPAWIARQQMQQPITQPTAPLVQQQQQQPPFAAPFSFPPLQQQPQPFGMYGQPFPPYAPGNQQVGQPVVMAGASNGSVPTSTGEPRRFRLRAGLLSSAMPD
jgi:hypothetical protein